MLIVGDSVKIIDPQSKYYGSETKVASICGIRRQYIFLEIDGEEKDWLETQLTKIITKDPNFVNVTK